MALAREGRGWAVSLSPLSLTESGGRRAPDMLHACQPVYDQSRVLRTFGTYEDVQHALTYWDTHSAECC